MFNSLICVYSDLDDGWLCEAAVPLSAMPGGVSDKYLVRFSIRKDGREDFSPWEEIRLYLHL